MCMVYFVLALAVVYVVMAMVPRRGQGSSASLTGTRPLVLETQNGQQRAEKRRVLGIMFLMAAKEYHYNRADRYAVHKTYYQIMLSGTLLMERYYNVVDQFLSTIGTVESPNCEKVFAEMSRMECAFSHSAERIVDELGLYTLKTVEICGKTWPVKAYSWFNSITNPTTKIFLRM